MERIVSQMQAPCFGPVPRLFGHVIIQRTRKRNVMAELTDQVLIQYKGQNYLSDASLIRLSFLINNVAISVFFLRAVLKKAWLSSGLKQGLFTYFNDAHTI